MATNTPFPSRPLASGLTRGALSGAGGAQPGGFGTSAATQQHREAARIERERAERAERERLERAGQSQLAELSEEQREEIDEAVRLMPS